MIYPDNMTRKHFGKQNRRKKLLADVAAGKREMPVTKKVVVEEPKAE